MEIVLSKHMGFCQGVERAVKMTLDSGATCTLGPLIHNPQMVEKLKEQGIEPLESLDQAEAGRKVVFRSHGEAPQRYEEAKNRALEIVDATCPYVKQAQQAACDLAREGYRVVIIGEARHPEVLSIKAWAGPGAFVAETTEDVAALPDGGRYGIVAQTTSAEETFQKLRGLIAKKAAIIKEVRTICKATTDRQDAAVELAKQVDVMVVVGGKNSANSNHLRDIVSGCCPKTFFIETVKELLPEMFKGVARAGVTAGASTPGWLIEEVVEKMQNMETGESTMNEVKTGEIITGTVVSVGKDEVFLDIKHKSEAVIPRQEMALVPPEDLSELVKVGDEISALVLNPDQDGSAVLSKMRADSLQAWDKLAKAKEDDRDIDVIVTSAVKGGVTVDAMGVRGFIPASHLDVQRIENLAEFVGKKITAKIIELETEGDKKRVVLSRREVLKAQKAVEEKALYAKVAVGEKYEGTVVRLANFGAFIDIGGVDGLLHVSDMAWHRVKHPSDVLETGDKVQVLVKSVDAENKKISLNMRDLLPDPWLAAIVNIKEGQILEGKVSKILPFGAFVLLPDTNLEGLVHISEIAEERVERPDLVLKQDQLVKVKVLGVEKKTKKISLSIAQAQHDSEKNELKEFMGQNAEFTTSIGSKFDLSKLLDK